MLPTTGGHLLRIRQIVSVVRNLASTSRQLAELLALDPPYRDPSVAEFGIDNAVYAFGDQFIELISPGGVMPKDVSQPNACCGVRAGGLRLCVAFGLGR